MIGRYSPSLSQAQVFPSFSQVSNCFVTFEYGNGLPSLTQEVVPGRQVAEPEVPTRQGHTFDGWLFDGVPWDFDTPVGGDNITLHARWIANTYIIVYYGNHTDATGATENSIHVFDTEQPLSINGFARTGYAFAGWNTEADGSGKSFSDGQIVNNLADAMGAVVTLYAQWEVKVFNIAYYLNFGVNNPDNPSTYTIDDGDIMLKNPTRGDDNFIAWYEDAAFSREPIEIIHTQLARNFTLYAKFLTKRKILSIAAELADDRFEGDLKLYLTPNGADIRYESGQAVMERGLENHALMSLFTKEGWCGNAFLPPENRIGSDFEKTCAGSITLSKLADIENAAMRALAGKAFPHIEAIAFNPRSDHLRVEITAHGGSAMSLVREGALWRNQRERLDHSRGA